MKKLLLIGAVALVAAAFFGCAVVSEEEAPEYDALGRRLVKFSVPTRAYENHIGGGGSIRALSKDLAQSAWDYIEVVFKSGDDEYYVGTGMKGNDVHFALPAGEYQAVMFAGVAAGKKLLAVGVPTGVDGSDDDVDGQGSITIGTSTKRITFTLNALTADVTAGSLTINEKAPASAGLTFKIPTGAGLNSQTASAVEGKNPPYFATPGNVHGLKGEFTIGGFKVAGVGVPDAGDLFETAGLFGVLDAADSEKIVQTIGLTGYDTTTETFITPAAVGGTVKEIGIVGGELKVDFDLATDVNSLTEGFSVIWFDVPIQAFTAGAAEAGRGSVWHIVNGLEAAYDRGGDSNGRNILLYVKIEKTYYVADYGSDTLGDGKTADTAFATLAKAYDAAKGDPNCERIVVLTNITETGLVTLDGGGAVNTNVITIEGSYGTEKLTRSGGQNNSVIQIQGGAKVSFQRIEVDGKYSTTVYNRGLNVTGGTTEVTLEAGSVISGTLIVQENNGGGVQVAGGARLTMTGGKISGNTATSGSNTYGGGVYVTGAGTIFEMKGGEISGSTGRNGGGVDVSNSGTFTMSGGVISDNTTSYGGGVSVRSGIFEMSGGVISGNTATGATTSGGGVFVQSTFTLSGGVISGNTATGTSRGGAGVYVTGIFTMSGGEISGNTANSNSKGGGGVYVTGTFTKAPASGGSTSGVIYGYIPGSALGNLVGTRKPNKTPDAASHVAGKGDAVYYDTDSKYRDSTLGADQSFSLAAGPWDN